MRSVLRWAMTTAGAVVVTPFLQAPATKLAEKLHFDALLSERWEPLMQWLSDLAANPWYIFAAGAFVGVPIGLWADLLLRRREAVKSPPPYINTRLRIRRDPSGDGHLLEAQSNIRNWQQVYTAIYTQPNEKAPNVVLARTDVLTIVFDKQTVYSRPIIDTFGTQPGNYNLFPLDTSGYVIAISGLEKIGMFDIWFPPPDHYDARHLSEANLASDPLPQSQS